MNTFKGQHNEEIKSLCLENNYELIIVPHNFTYKFQSLDLTITQKAKKFVSNQFNKWYAERVSRQLANGKSPGRCQSFPEIERSETTTRKMGD